jgi:hypothetical protein
MAGINHTINNTYDVTINNTYDVISNKNIDEEESVRNPKPDTLERTPLNSTSFQSFSGVTNKSCVNYDSVNRTIYLCGGSTNLSSINRIINSSDALNNTSDKYWILNANISIANNATLFINSTDTRWLRILDSFQPIHKAWEFSKMEQKLVLGIQLASLKVF